MPNAPVCAGLRGCAGQKPKELCGSGSVRNMRDSSRMVEGLAAVMRPAWASRCADMPPR